MYLFYYQINETRIENLGNGVAYCMLLNHYCPTAIHPSKIIHFPRTHNDHRTNLRRFQEGLNSHDIRNITFDVRISLAGVQNRGNDLRIELDPYLQIT